MNHRAYTEKIRTETELSRQMLETTRMTAGCWLLAIERWPESRHPSIERMVEEAAWFDWGHGAQVRFEYDSRRVVVFDELRIQAIDEVPEEIRTEYQGVKK